MDSFGEYLSQPCDECPSSAIYNGNSRATGKRGQYCQEHVDFDASLFSRDD